MFPSYHAPDVNSPRYTPGKHSFCFHEIVDLLLEDQLCGRFKCIGMAMVAEKRVAQVFERLTNCEITIILRQLVLNCITIR
jgi:hypothetical protein